MKREEKFRSIFNRRFDVGVYGTGLVGIAAATALAAKGRSVLLVGPGGDLAWETSRALENTTATSRPCPAWENWLAPLRQRRGADGRFFDPVLAEVSIAAAFHGPGVGVRTLLYAIPIHVDVGQGRIRQVTVATKSGLRHLNAAHWMDASENGALAALCGFAASPQTPKSTVHGMVCQSPHPEVLEAAMDRIVREEAGASWTASLRTTERRLRFESCGEWNSRIVSLTRRLRETSDAPVLLSHASSRPLPIYAGCATGPGTSGPENFTLLSPSVWSEAVRTPGDRFAIGAGCPNPKIHHSTFSQVRDLPLPPAAAGQWDVLVAGAGTAGAVAAIAAARNGARTLVIDASHLPGGVGTVGGISGYFHGAAGGLQTEIDARVQALSEAFTGQPYGPKRWHHLAKSIVLLEMFAEAGVEFLPETILVDLEHHNGTVRAALCAKNERLQRFEASHFVDCTGDGDLCALAGAEFDLGRAGDARFLAFSQGAHQLAVTRESIALKHANYDAGWVDPTDPEDLSRARLQGIAQFLRDDWTAPDRPVAIAPLLGVRGSRHIRTDYKVCLRDMVAGVVFDDAIGEVKTVADTHSVDFEFEDDETAFYYWCCRAFRHPLHCALPYRMLLPRGLDNVWIACRAAGIEQSAHYGLRMQREMQRLGEAAGIAAALAAREHSSSRKIDFGQLAALLEKSGARPTGRKTPPPLQTVELLQALETGVPGIHLWHLYHADPRPCGEVRACLAHQNPVVAFHAACILAMWGDVAAAPRLLQAIREREAGPGPDSPRVPGAHGECIDIPFWLQAVVMLRRCGTPACLPALEELAAEPGLPFNVRTCIATSLESLAFRGNHTDAILRILGSLRAGLDDAVSFLPPSRSLWRTLNDEAQKKLPNDRGQDTRQDHRWQLDLIEFRVRKQLQLPVENHAVSDPRGFVRLAFGGVRQQA